MTWPAISPAERLRCNAHLRREAELAVDGAADLAGDADGGSPGAGAGRLGSAAISLLSPVAARHPDRLHRLPVLARNQVALGAVDGAEGLDNPGPGNDPALVGHGFSQLARQGMYLVEGGGPLLKHGLKQLAGPVGGLAKLQH